MKTKAKLLLQIALDVVSLDKALTVVGQAAGEADRLEVGTPLLLAAGMEAVRALRSLRPSDLIIADTKICDAGERIATTAIAAGADVITIVPVAADQVTWAGVRRSAEAAGRPIRIMADLIGAADPVEAARQAAEQGADELCFHLPKRTPGAPLDLARVRAVAEAVTLPIFVAGGLQPPDAGLLGTCNAAGLIIGGAVTGAPDPAAVLRSFRV